MKCILLNLNEFCEYLGIGKTKAREILRDPDCEFSVQVGNRWYAHKEKLDRVLDQRAPQIGVMW